MSATKSYSSTACVLLTFLYIVSFSFAFKLPASQIKYVDNCRHFRTVRGQNKATLRAAPADLTEGISAVVGHISIESALLPGVGIVSGLFLAFKLAIYWRMQYLTASIIAGIPSGSSVVELDATDGKNVFYFPKAIDYTAIMSVGTDSDPKKQKEKAKVNEQLILECIGKANREGLQLSGKVRSKSQEIPSKSADCVLSVGAIGRSKDSAVEVSTEAFRILRPGGLFVFVEPDGDGQLIEAIAKVFPKTITSSTSAGDKARKAQAKKAEEMSMVVAATGPKRKRDSRGKKGFSQPGLENVGVFAAEELSASDPSATPASDVSEVEDKEASSAASQPTDAAQGGTNSDMKTRPGITYERVQNLFEPYATGIAVRP